jgi:hypothetical protein
MADRARPNVVFMLGDNIGWGTELLWGDGQDPAT